MKMTDTKDVDPYKDEWDTSMLPEFDNNQLINALHYCIDTIYKNAGFDKGFGKLTRLFFNSVINEIKSRMK